MHRSPAAKNYVAQNVSIAKVENLSLGQSISFCETSLTLGEVSVSNFGSIISMILSGNENPHCTQSPYGDDFSHSPLS